MFSSLKTVLQLLLIISLFWTIHATLSGNASVWVMSAHANTPAPAPSATVGFGSASYYVGDTWSVSWWSTNATSHSFVCSWGYNSNSNTLPSSGNNSGPVTPEMVGTTTCTLTASGPGGVASNSSSFSVSHRAPTLSVSDNWDNLMAGGTFNVSWSTANATSVSFVCSWAYNENSNPGVNTSKSIPVTPSMVGTTTCTSTASGPGGSVSSSKSFYISPIPITYNITFADYESGINASRTVWTAAGRFTNAGTANFTVYDFRGNYSYCNPTARLASGVLIGEGSCTPVVIPPPTCDTGFVWNGNACIITPGYTTTFTLSQGDGACTNQPVTVSANCSGVGCPVQDIVRNSPTNGLLMARDVTGVSTPVPYTVNNIDIGIPTLGSFTIENQGPTASIRAKAAVDLKVLVNDPKHPLIEVHCRKDITVVATLSSPGIAGISPASSGSSTTTINEGTLMSINSIAVSTRGVYTLTLNITDKAGNNIIQTFPNALTIFPNEFDPSTSSVTLVTSGGAAGSKFANGSDSYQYEVVLKDAFNNAITSKNIERVTQAWVKSIGLDMRSPNTPNWENAIFTDVVGLTKKITDNTGKFTFSVSSINFGEFSESFNFYLSSWDNRYNDVGVPILRATRPSSMVNRFKKPYTAQLAVISNPKILQVGGMQNTQITVAKTGWGTVPPLAPDYRVASLSSMDIEATSIGHTVYAIGSDMTSSFRAPDGDPTQIIFPTYQSRIEATSTTSADTDPAIAFKKDTNPVISYSMNYRDVNGISAPKIVQYRLTPAGNDDGILSLSWVKFVGLSVNGSVQAVGKKTEVNVNSANAFQQNFSDVGASSLRSSIRKNAYELVRNMVSGTVVNNVKYVRWDLTLTTAPSDYETLVIIDGNLIINGDIDIPTPFGIIVLAEADTSKGNIFITPNVGYITALIFSDGSIQSANAAGAPYAADSVARTNILNKQLVFFGSLITRNTIGGALKSATDGIYKLPVNVTEAPSFDSAVKYDLNYLRRGSEWAIPSRYGESTNITKPTVIRYNPNANKNPPKWFYVR